MESNKEEIAMSKLLLGIAASIAAIGIAAPAAAGTPEEPFVGYPGAKGDLGTFAGGGFHVGVGQSGFGQHRRDRRSGDGGGIWVNGGQWAQYNNQSFKSDSYNDWWHDQPWRSQPAWVRNNQSCRQYWSGGGWRC
jgi:hypothetical protein